MIIVDKRRQTPKNILETWYTYRSFIRKLINFSVTHVKIDFKRSEWTMKKPFSKLFGLKNKEDIVDYIEENRHSSVESIQIERIVPNRYQPRQVFDSSKITELAESIEEHGLLQPIVVRPIEENMYEIIAGERRFRALQSLHQSKADVIIRHMNDEETAVVALLRISNVKIYLQ